MNNRVNTLQTYLDLYEKLGMGGVANSWTPTDNSAFALTKPPANSLSSGQQARNAMRWAEEQAAKEDRGSFFRNMFGGQGGGGFGGMPQFNTPMPNNPYSQRVDQFQQPDPVQGKVKNYLAQMFSQQPSSPIGYRNG